MTAALARWYTRQGKRVRVFKTGPDFLDPQILERASGSPVYSLHLWMVGEEACRALLFEAARQADVILVEGVMGLYDGKPSGADLATVFGIPVLAVIDAQAMAQTFAAVAFGLARFQSDLPFHGVFANRVNSQGHADLLQENLPTGIAWAGHMASSAEITLPSRHLGLTQADEIEDLDLRLDRAADALGQTPLAVLPPAVSFFAPDAVLNGLPNSLFPTNALAGHRIAIARDAAFAFIYPANLDLLRSLGASVITFSPLADEPLPENADAVFLPGGYPELHAEQLSRQGITAASLRRHIDAGKPVWAECGGMLYLLDALKDAQEKSWPMLGLLPGEAAMQAKLAALGMHKLDTPLGELRGHTFHYSKMQSPMASCGQTRHATRHSPGEFIYQHQGVIATYFHAYWPSNPRAIAALFTGNLFST